MEKVEQWSKRTDGAGKPIGRCSMAKGIGLRGSVVKVKALFLRKYSLDFNQYIIRKDCTYYYCKVRLGIVTKRSATMLDCQSLWLRLEVCHSDSFYFSQIWGIV